MPAAAAENQPSVSASRSSVARGRQVSEPKLASLHGPTGRKHAANARRAQVRDLERARRGARCGVRASRWAERSPQAPPCVAKLGVSAPLA